ncbi:MULTISPECIES: hypothetical protein [unclassified Pseudomonas]|nr:MULTISPECIES: hypothetical protein [unclassified Pseudomonas]
MTGSVPVRSSAARAALDLKTAEDVEANESALDLKTAEGIEATTC